MQWNMMYIKPVIFVFQMCRKVVEIYKHTFGHVPTSTNTHW